MRRLLFASVLLGVAACRDYDRYGYVSSQKGLLPADSFAKYGPDQAIATAVGREFGKAHSGSSDADYGKQAETAVAYGKKFSQVKSISVDSLGYRLVITFNDGWTSQVTPISDGKRGDDTPNLPKGAK
jgi:hypothetical protein